MNVAGRTIVVTGATGGIGRQLVLALAAADAHVVATDRDPDAVQRLSIELGEGHLTQACDVADEAAFQSFLAETEATVGGVDVFVGNAGVAVGGGPVDTPDLLWEQAFEVNVRQHILAARVLVPGWLERGEGYFVSVASAAGLLTQIGSAPYSVTKHAAVAFAEWMSVTYGSRGIRVSCVCPMGVDTQMLQPGSGGALEDLAARVVRGAGAVLTAEAVADAIIEGIRAERFLIAPHPEVVGYFQRKASDYERWLAGMRRLQDQTRGV